MGPTFFRLLIGFAAWMGSPFTPEEQEKYFPDLVFCPRNKAHNAIVVELTDVHLKAMKEPSLWKLSQLDRKATVYRFLWLATNEHPICIRLTKTGDNYRLHVARHDGPPGDTAGRLTVDKEVKIEAEQGERLVELLEKSSFWNAPVSVKESRGRADGDRLVIEGVKNGKYHVVDRAGSIAGESFQKFCRGLLEPADEPIVIKSWDNFRKSERERPDYRPEPPQTEDLGEVEKDQEFLDDNAEPEGF